MHDNTKKSSELQTNDRQHNCRTGSGFLDEKVRKQENKTFVIVGHLKKPLWNN